MKTIEEYKTFVDNSFKVKNDIENTAKDAVTAIVAENGKIVFDYENDDAPCIASINFDEDLTDCYIMELHAEQREVYADLYAYYSGETRSNIELSFDEPNVNWLDLLEYLVNRYDKPLTIPNVKMCE